LPLCRLQGTLVKQRDAPYAWVWRANTDATTLFKHLAPAGSEGLRATAYSLLTRTIYPHLLPLFISLHCPFMGLHTHCPTHTCWALPAPAPPHTPPHLPHTWTGQILGRRWACQTCVFPSSLVNTTAAHKHKLGPRRLRTFISYILMDLRHTHHTHYPTFSTHTLYTHHTQAHTHTLHGVLFPVLFGDGHRCAPAHHPTPP